MTDLSFNIIAFTHTGLIREHNEDNFIYSSDSRLRKWHNHHELTVAESPIALFVVSDGMGGAAAGEVASQIVIETIQSHFSSSGNEQLTQMSDQIVRKNLINAILSCHNTIKTVSKLDASKRGMGATVVMALAIGHDLHVCWVGDSRLYRIMSPHGTFNKQDRKLELLTADHSLVWELVTKGDLTPEQARTHTHSNVITQSLGDNVADPQPGYLKTDLYQGDRLMLCSDGINGELPDELISDILMANDNIETTIADVTDATLKSGGQDNFTSIIIEILGGEIREKKSEVSQKKTITTGATIEIKTSKDPLNKVGNKTPKLPSSGFNPLNLVMYSILGLIIFGGAWYFLKQDADIDELIVENKKDEVLRLLDQSDDDSLKSVMSAMIEKNDLDNKGNTEAYFDELYRIEELINTNLSNLNSIASSRGMVLDSTSIDTLTSPLTITALSSSDTVHLAERLDAIKSNYDLLRSENKLKELPAVENEFITLKNKLDQKTEMSPEDQKKLSERINYLEIVIQKNHN